MLLLLFDTFCGDRCCVVFVDVVVIPLLHLFALLNIITCCCCYDVDTAMILCCYYIIWCYCCYMFTDWHYLTEMILHSVICWYLFVIVKPFVFYLCCAVLLIVTLLLLADIIISDYLLLWYWYWYCDIVDLWPYIVVDVVDCFDVYSWYICPLHSSFICIHTRWPINLHLLILWPINVVQCCGNDVDDTWYLMMLMLLILLHCWCCCWLHFIYVLYIVDITHLIACCWYCCWLLLH